jgi:hypothetical protein
LRVTDLAGQPIDDHRHSVAGVIDEQLLAAHVGLAHGDRELRLKAPVELTKPRVPIPAWLTLDVLLPERHERDVLALQLAMDGGPVRLGMTAVALLRPATTEQLCLQHLVGDLIPQRPTQAGGPETLERQSHRRRRHAKTPGDLAGRYATNKLQLKNFAHLAHGSPLCWHWGPFLGKPKDRTRAARRGHHPGD